MTVPVADHASVTPRISVFTLFPDLIEAHATTSLLGRARAAGVLEVRATPVHRGRTQQLWTVSVTDEADRLVARGEVRLANITDPAQIGAPAS